MTLEQFRDTIAASAPPPSVSNHLKALWYAAKNDWEQSHNIIQDIEDIDAAWIHAYLHRKEGDTGNADYWYRRAGRKRPSVSLEQEWKNIVATLIEN